MSVLSKNILGLRHPKSGRMRSFHVRILATNLNLNCNFMLPLLNPIMAVIRRIRFSQWFRGKRYCTGRPREKQRASKENPPKKTKQKFFGLCVRERGTVASREWKSRSWNWPNAIFCVSSLFLSLSLSFVKKLWTSQGLCEGKLGPAPFSRASTSF